MTVPDAVGHISLLTGIHIAAEVAKGLGAIIAATVADRIAAGMTADTVAGMTADTVAGMTEQEVAAGISALHNNNMSVLKLTDTDDLTQVIVAAAEVRAGTRTGEEETKIAETDKKARQIRHLTMLC